MATTSRTEIRVRSNPASPPVSRPDYRPLRPSGGRLPALPAPAVTPGPAVLPPHRQRSGLFVLLMVFVVAAGSIWWGRGRGYKSLLKRLVHPAAVAPVLHAGRPGGEINADPSIAFQKVALPVTNGTGFTCVQIGPDHRLYASADDGRIFRFPISADGTLGEPQVIDALQTFEGGKRLVSGFCFDPHSTAERPIVWVSNSWYGFHDAPDFTGKLSRMSGPDLERVEDVVVELPRSFKDHLNNQPSFGPDGALYFPQGSSSTYGAPDGEWGFRHEHLLNATVLRLDVSKLKPGEPLDVRTPDAGGTYDPYAPDAPLTIYACGIRNAFDLVWADNGRLYVPVNGSSAGGNTPAGDDAPALSNIPDAEDDWLFRITPGKYYGHPNPAQHHFVLNGGNPTGQHRVGEIPQYPVGTKPDANWEPAAFDFGQHISADGVIQYHGRAFGGKLDGKLLVCRFNVGSDLICLGLDAAGNVSNVQVGITGLTDLAAPLDVTEDPTNGNLYVTEYGGKRITLMRPAAAGMSPVASR